ncbi:hypothetical protein JCM8097_009337 [Rhodosporidiobolus ruineniae]
MVWIVEGTLNNHQDDAPDTLPPISSHYLRPSRLYKVGRMGGVRAPPKSGQTKPGPASRHRPYDFRIASLAVSKEGMCEFECGGEDWVATDDPNSPSNGAPYPLTVRVNRKFHVTRENGEMLEMSAAEGENVVEIQDGDAFQVVGKEYNFKFTWIPIFVCIATAAAAAKKDYLEKGKSLGIKIAFKNYLPHHTHFLNKAAVPTPSLLSAAVHSARVASPTWLNELHERSLTPARPSQPLPSPPDHPGPSASKDDLASYDKSLSAFEKQLLELNHDVGADWQRWWGHSHLERDWGIAYPREEKYPPEVAPQAPNWDPRRWDRDERRKSVLEGCLFVSFRGCPAQDDTDASIVSSASGAFFACDLLQRSPLPSLSNLLSAIDGFKTDHAFPGACRVVLVAPLGLDVDEGEEEMDEHQRGQVERLRELQAALKVGKLCHGSEIATAIYEVDTSILFADVVEVPPEAGTSAGGSSMQRKGSSGSSGRRTQTSQFTQPFPTGGIPGTHPESGLPASSSAAVATQEAAPAGSAENSQDSSGGPSQPKKRLTRRARTGRDAFEDLFADEEVGGGSGGGSGGRTQRSAATQEEETGGSRKGTERAEMEIDPATPANPPAPTGRTTTLKRRAGQRDVLAAMFGDDSPEKDADSGSTAATQTQSYPEEVFRKKGKTRQERMAAIEEEDQRLAQEEAQTQAAAGPSKGKGRAVQDDGGAAAGGRRKRDKSAALGSGGSDDEREPARKRSSKKEGAAPVSTTSKRSRAMSRDPDAGSSSEDSAGRTARKRSKAPDEPKEPKTKKEQAALKKAEKEAKAAEAAKLLQVKTTRRKGAEADQQFNDDFNALKIVKPVIKSMPRVEKHRFTWDEEDSDVERHNALVEEDQRRLGHGDAGAGDGTDDDMNPDNWRRPTQAMFVIRTMEVERKERPPPRTEVDERYAGQPNFKKFRPKNAKGPREPLAQRPQIQLVVPESQDYGLGAGYNDRKGTAFSQVQQADDEDDEVELLRAMGTSKSQAKLTFSKSKAKAKALAKKTASKSKGKGKAKQVIADDEDEEDQLDSDGDDFRSSNTLRADEMDLDDDDNDASPPARSTASRSKKAASSSSSARPARKAAPTTLILDSDSDSDTGKFQGFGKGRSGR